MAGITCIAQYKSCSSSFFRFKNNSKIGIINSRILNELNYFHVTENYASNIMHDLLEGVYPLIIRLVLNTLISQTNLNLNLINKRIESFNYGSCEMSNKPPPLSDASFSFKRSPIKMSASEMWCLIVNLPLILSELIAKNNEYW